MPAAPGATAPDIIPRAAADAWPGPSVLELLHKGPITEIWSGALPSGRPVAWKRLRPDRLRDVGARALLRREQRLLDVLRHPFISESLAYVERSDCCAIAIELLPSGDLVPLAGTAPRHWSTALLGVVAALEHMHRQGFIHTDVKARNVLFAADGTAKLIDLGSAVAYGEPLPRGGRTDVHTPRGRSLAAQLAAPGAPARPELDVYALAVLLYELLFDRLPDGSPAAVSAPERICEDSTARLAAAVSGTLAARSVEEVGTLTTFRNVLESIHSRAVDSSN